MSWKAAVGGVTAIAAAVVAVVLIAGGDGGTSDAKQTDDDFMGQMTSHHQMAIDMAEMAQERGEHRQVKELANAIVQAQGSEIEQMGSIHDRMFGGAIEAHEHGTMGMSPAEMGMGMDMSALATAKPFDQAFIDQMIPHHQGAIRMARIVLERGQDDEIAAIAEAIIEGQSREIEQMNGWREDWYGAPSPAGGVAGGETDTPSHESMGH